MLKKSPRTYEAVEAFSADEITPIDISSGIPEIEEEAEMEGEEDKSLFDDEGSQPFESYFNVNSSDVRIMTEARLFRGSARG